jgi:hypothetical protein
MRLNYTRAQSDTRPARRFLLIALTVCAIIVGFRLFGGASFDFLQHVSDQDPVLGCAANMHVIGLSTLMYANNHQDRLPDRFEDLFDEDITADRFCCPISNDMPATGPTTQAIAANLSAGGHLSYVYLGKGLVNPVPKDVIVAYEIPGHHGTRGSYVLFGDGHFHVLDPSEMARLLAVVQSSRNAPPIRWPSREPYVQPTTEPTSAK